jgi:hypothetical protein
VVTPFAGRISASRVRIGQPDLGTGLHLDGADPLHNQVRNILQADLSTVIHE